MGKLITPSILSAAAFARSAPPSWRERAAEGLKKQLSRIYDDVMPAPVRRGIDFENRVYQCARRPPGAWRSSPLFREVVDQVRGGLYQEKAKADIVVDGVDYTLYGKVDVLMPSVIIDIKTTGKRPSPGKYLGTAQHLIYSYALDISKFEYLVVVMDDTNKITEYFTIPWESPGQDIVLQQIEGKIREFISTLEAMSFINLYNDKFCLY